MVWAAVCSRVTTVRIGMLWRLEVYASVVFLLVAFLFVGAIGIVFQAGTQWVPLLGPSYPKVARIPNRQGKSKYTKTFGQLLRVSFPTIKKLFCEENWGYLYSQVLRYIYIFAHVFSPYISTYEGPN